MKFFERMKAINDEFESISEADRTVRFDRDAPVGWWNRPAVIGALIVANAIETAAERLAVAIEGRRTP